MIPTMILQFLAAAVGTIAFSVIFYVPRRYYPSCGIIGGLGWIVYLICGRGFALPAEIAAFLATAVIMFSSRLCATAQKCPVTLFLVPGIFPIVPGMGIYWTVYYMIMEDVEQVSYYGRMTLHTAIAIVLGIIFVFEVPNEWIKKLCRIWRKQ